MVQPKSKTGKPVEPVEPAAKVAAKTVVRKPPVKAAAPKAAAPQAEPTKVEPIKAEPVAAHVLEAAPVPEVTPEIETAPAAEAAPEPVELAAEPVEIAPVAPAPVMASMTTEAPIIKNPVLTPILTPILTLKDISMTTDFTATMSDAVTEVQAKLQTAYDKSSTMVAEMTDLAKGNVEAVVESTKLFAAGMQDMGKSYADEAKSAYETATADMKEMAAIKSPTELFQLQGKIMRRNFDLLVAATSKTSDAALKLANEAMAPISGRVNLTAERLSQAAA